jgi:hypothetical protein
MLRKLNFIKIWVSDSITEFERKMENKNILWNWSLVDQKRRLALEMLTSETAHTGEGGHTCKTTSRQNLSN